MEYVGAVSQFAKFVGVCSIIFHYIPKFMRP
jgi:hypothetical protein